MFRNYFAYVLVQVIEGGRIAAGRIVNQAMTTTYWLVGRQIVEHEQRGARRAEYGEELLERLSADLTARVGSSFSRRNLQQMRSFYLWKSIWQTPSAKLGGVEIAQTVFAKSSAVELPRFPLPWSHYSRLLSVRDTDARAHYEEQALHGGWSVRQLDRQIATLAFQRRRGKPGQLKGEDVDADMLIRDPFVLEFLHLKWFDLTLGTAENPERLVSKHRDKLDALLMPGSFDKVWIYDRWARQIIWSGAKP